MKVFAYVSVFWLSCVVKLFCMPFYRSTDFEVHRNWLAITHSLPLGHWYYERTSEWTLDYPPFFAWFEWALSQVGALVDPGMVTVSNLNYASTATVVFQRFTVIFADLVLFAGLVIYVTARDEHTYERVDPALEPATAGRLTSGVNGGNGGNTAYSTTNTTDAENKGAKGKAEAPDSPPFLPSNPHSSLGNGNISNGTACSVSNAAPAAFAVPAATSAWTSERLAGPSPICLPLRSSAPPLRPPRVSKPLIVFALALLHPCLLLVDHIHFQYNGFLLGMLIASVGLHRRGHDLAGATVFAVLLYFKHIFLYIAPAYFVYLLAKYCFVPADDVAPAAAAPAASRTGAAVSAAEAEIKSKGKGKGQSAAPTASSASTGSAGGPARQRFSPRRFLALGAVVAGVSLLSLGPVLLAHPPPQYARAEAIRLGLIPNPGAGDSAIASAVTKTAATATLESSATAAPAASGDAEAGAEVLLPLLPRVALNGRQLLSRLFPFGRGLTHAYWAPNVWALYNGADRGLVLAGKAMRALLVKTGLAAKLPPTHTVSASAVAGAAAAGAAAAGANAGPETAAAKPALVSPTSGLVQDVVHLALPTVTPAITALLTLLAMLPALAVLWRSPAPRVFAAALVYCSLCSFMLGWHVHEKAILLALLPMTLSCLDSERQTRTYLLAYPAATTSILPLVTIHPPTVPAALALVAVFTVLQHTLIDLEGAEIAGARRFRYRGIGEVMTTAEKVYLWGIPVAFTSLYVVDLLLPRFEFLPLMIVSCYSALGLVAVWAHQLGDLRGLEVLVHSYNDDKHSHSHSHSHGHGHGLGLWGADCDSNSNSNSNGSLGVGASVSSVRAARIVAAAAAAAAAASGGLAGAAAAGKSQSKGSKSSAAAVANAAEVAAASEAKSEPKSSKSKSQSKAQGPEQSKGVEHNDDDGGDANGADNAAVGGGEGSADGEGHGLRERTRTATAANSARATETATSARGSKKGKAK